MYGNCCARIMLFALACFVPVTIMACSADPQPSDVEETALAIHDSIPWKTTEEPDVVLLVARANAHLVARGIHSGEGQLRRQLDRLVQMRTKTAEGGWGWGLSYSWDAFGDGMVNPADTIYSYTTAAAALALLDGYEVLGEERYLTAAARTADTLLKDTCCWQQGDYLSVWYSNRPNDQRDERQVHNVNGLALAVLARLDEHLSKPRYQQERTAMATHLRDKQGLGYTRDSVDGTEVSDANWRYARGEDRPNDLIHESFIVEGLLAHGTEEALRAARSSLDGILGTHFDQRGVPREGPHTFGSLDWGPAAGLYILASSEQHRQGAGKIASYLAGTVDDSGRTTLADQEELRAQAWYALGLARYANPAGL